jgi:hypothetical protein
MLVPHHCSWRSLSYDSWSDLGESAKVSKDARSALGQAKSSAFIVASSKEIEDDEDDPPCIRAKREYESILKPVNGTFLNTALHGSESDPTPLEFEVTVNGPVVRAARKETADDLRKASSLLRAPTAATVPTGLAFPPRPVKPTKPAGFA